ncbi:MAG: hypothetical protein WCQ32_03875 [bacterium]
MSNCIELFHFNEIWDENGDQLFKDNLYQLFDYLEKKKLLNNKKQKYSFYVSKVYYKNRSGSPYREIKIRTGTIRKIYNYWEVTFGHKFSLEKLIQYREKKPFEMEHYEKEARGRVAWAQHSYVVRIHNETKEYEEIQKLPSDKRDLALKNFQNKSNPFIIG